MLGPTPDPLMFRTLYESTLCASVAVLPDAPQFTIVAASDAYLQLAGVKRAQLESRSLFETAPYNAVAPSEKTLIQDLLERLQSAKRVARSLEDDAGLTFESDRYPWIMAPTPVFDAEGRCMALMLTLDRLQPEQGSPSASAGCTNVQSIDRPSHRQAAPEDTRSLPLPSRVVFDQAAPGFAIFDLAGHVVDCNPAFAKLVGRTREELYTLNSEVLIHPEDRDRSRRDIQKLISGKSSAVVIEKRYLRPNGAVVWVRNSVSIIRATAGRPQQLVTISEDLTLLRMAEQALIKNEKLAAVGRLSASIVHELNNPLEAVTNLLFLIGNASEMKDVRRYVGLAEQELGRVTQIATQTLRFYRHESGPVAVQIADVIDSVLALFEGRLRRRDVKVIKRYAQIPDQMLANSGEVRQVFVNLISNALDAMGETGVLRINVRPARSLQRPEISGVRVTVCDTGSGIPHEMLEKIFEPFISTKENSGTGLGLWISKEIIRRHGGTLRVRSSVSGARRGTAMSIFLPRNTTAAAA